MNVLILGYGSIGARHLESCLRLYPDHKYAVLRSTAAKKDIPTGVKVFTSPSELKEFVPDLVYLCTPTAQHATSLQNIENFLPSHCTFFLEKPLAHKKDDLSYISNLMQQFSFRFFYGCVLRHHPVVKKTKELLISGALGKALSYNMVCASYLPEWRPNQNYREVYSAKRAEGGGVVLDLIHEFDLAQFFFGPIDRLSGIHTKMSNLDIDSDDLCLAHLRHATTLGSINLNYFGRGSRRTFDIYCEYGTLAGDLIESSLTLTGQGNKSEAFSFKISRTELYDAQTHFVFKKLHNFSDEGYFNESLELNHKLITFLEESGQ